MSSFACQRAMHKHRDFVGLPEAATSPLSKLRRSVLGPYGLLKLARKRAYIIPTDPSAATPSLT